MAGPAPDFPLPSASLFNIYTDGPLALNSPGLPGGPCNFVDLTHGANGVKCGCRRFWSRGAPSRLDRGSPIGNSPGFANGFPYGNGGPVLDDQTAWCMCSHHACYHDDVRDGQISVGSAPMANTGVMEQENERPRNNREPLTPVIPDLSFKMPPGNGQGQPLDLFTFDNADSSFPVYHTEGVDLQQQSIIAAVPPAKEASLPDTLSWTNFVQSEPGQEAGELPPIPSQCLMASQPSSTTSSTRLGYLRPFSGKGLQTLSGVKSSSKLRESLYEAEEDAGAARSEDEDPLDANVDPSVNEDEQTVTNTPRSSRHTDVAERQSSTLARGPSGDAFRLLSNTVQGHEQRLDNLESVSFSSAIHDNCYEKHDHADLRVTELESRVEEVEKILNDSSSVSGYHRSRRHGGGDDSTNSVVSISTTSSTIHTTDRSELVSQLQNLRAQLSALQGLSSFPSHTRPWEIEVIFFPFPLQNVWMEHREFNNSQRSSSGGNGVIDPDPWTQLPHNGWFNSADGESPGFSDWVPEVESDWLLARACAPDQMIGRRLRSRGLIKDIVVRGPDARSVQQAMSEAFGALFRTFSRIQSNVHHGSTVRQRATKFLGLQSPWIPLRKIHRDSRLRFLSPAEMVTPATWDVQFLSSSVAMKSGGTQRLFITHPEAYVQDLDAYENGWTWQRLRELSRVYEDSQSSANSSQQEVPEGDAKEDCWNWNKVLDEQHPSQSSRISLSPNTSQQQAAQILAASSHRMSMSPSQAVFTNRVLRTQSPGILKERRVIARPPHVRTTSMPPATVPTLVSPAHAVAKRRTTSYNNNVQALYERRPSPQVLRVATSSGQTSHAVTLAAKRRNSTRSPSVRLRNNINRYTPRWSTASPSPVPMAINEGYATGNPGRATTPFYATPYSNAPFIDTRPHRSNGSGVLILEDEDNDESGFDSDEDDDLDFHDDEDNDSPMEDVGHHDQSFDSQDTSSWQDGQARLPEDEPWPGIEDAENRDPAAIEFDDLDLSVQPHQGEHGVDDDINDDEIDIHVDDDAMMNDEQDDGEVGDFGKSPTYSHTGNTTIEGDGEDERQSQASSLPSEYPSTQQGWTARNPSLPGASGAVNTKDKEFRVFEDEDEDHHHHHHHNQYHHYPGSSRSHGSGFQSDKFGHDRQTGGTGNGK